MGILLAGLVYFKGDFESGNIALVKHRMVKMEQVHGNNVVIVGKKDEGKTIKNCDALITSEKNLELCVRVADCLPVFVEDIKGRALGIIHAGWRGLSKGVIKNTIKMMEEKLNINPRELTVYIGPHICQKHYEVRDNVSSLFSEYPKSIRKNGGEIFLDLGGIAREQITALGVENKNITIDKTCTFENSGLYSFRRDKTTGRNNYLVKI